VVSLTAEPTPVGLDLAAFRAPAIRTYVAVPFVLLDSEIAVTRERPGRRIEVTFSPAIRTHSRRQVLYIDDRMHITRHDYTAESIAPWAHAAQQVVRHDTIQGVLIGTGRVVHLRTRHGMPRRPTLVTVTLADNEGADHARE
jgi:hypothetical protein